MVQAARLPAVPQPARHVRVRTDLGARARAAAGDAGHARRASAAASSAPTSPWSSLVGGSAGSIGWQDSCSCRLPTALLAGAAGIWLFYVQHQFEDAYWETHEHWSYADAALQGSSYLRLPRVLQFFTGNIGLHHVHHLSARIPNYNLQARTTRTRVPNVPTLTLWDGLKCSRLKLFDEQSGRLVTFAEARASSSNS